MFAEVKAGINIKGNAYDVQIRQQIYAAVKDMTATADISLPGDVNISIDENTGAVTDNSTLTDAYAITAITAWCILHIGNPPNYKELLDSYNTIKGNMSRSSEYSAYSAE